MLAENDFDITDTRLAAHGCPCFLVRACDPGRLTDDWHLHGTRLLDLDRWDVRLIYSMAG
jgi:hypothetical protein